MGPYFLNRTAQDNGDHEVHREGCRWLTLAVSMQDLDVHFSCHSAVALAKRTHPTANGCAFCSPECHTR